MVNDKPTAFTLKTLNWALANGNITMALEAINALGPRQLPQDAYFEILKRLLWHNSQQAIASLQKELEQRPSLFSKFRKQAISTGEFGILMRTAQKLPELPISRPEWYRVVRNCDKIFVTSPGLTADRLLDSPRAALRDTPGYHYDGTHHYYRPFWEDWEPNCPPDEHKAIKLAGYIRGRTIAGFSNTIPV